MLIAGTQRGFCASVCLRLLADREGVARGDEAKRAEHINLRHRDLVGDAAEVGCGTIGHCRPEITRSPSAASQWIVIPHLSAVIWTRTLSIAIRSRAVVLVDARDAHAEMSTPDAAAPSPRRAVAPGGCCSSLSRIADVRVEVKVGIAAHRSPAGLKSVAARRNSIGSTAGVALIPSYQPPERGHGLHRPVAARSNPR